MFISNRVKNFLKIFIFVLDYYQFLLKTRWISRHLVPVEARVFSGSFIVLKIVSAALATVMAS
jgi:hypothetical protein